MGSYGKLADALQVHTLICLVELFNLPPLLSGLPEFT